MHIRIGNDISFLISLSTLGVERIEDVKYAKGLFIALDQENIIHHPHNCHPQFYDSEYNIHDCGMLNYNAFPINANINHKHHHNHEFCVYEDCSSPVRTNENKDSLILLFPGKAQRYCGRYRVELELMLSDGKIRNVKINFGEQFTLVNDGSGQSGDITISLGNTGLDTDIYAKSATVEYLQNMNGQWSQFMLSSDKYIYDYIPKKTITVSVKEDNSKVAIISKYDDLYFTYNSFCFPVSRTNIGDYYLYVSSYYFDKQDISIQVSRVKNVEYPDIDFNLEGPPIVENVFICSSFEDINGTYISGMKLYIYARVDDADNETLLQSGPTLRYYKSGKEYLPISVTKHKDGVYKYRYAFISLDDNDETKLSDVFVPGEYIVKYGKDYQNVYNFTAFEDTVILDDNVMKSDYIQLYNETLHTYGMLNSNNMLML